MQYYYNLVVNLDEVFWEFYEWENTDHLVSIKKVPFIRINSNNFKNILINEIKVDKEWLKNYINKTIIKNKKEKATMILFSTTKNCILLEFEEDGKVLYRSKLLLEDENNCNEFSYALKEINIPYKKLEKLPLRKDYRKAIEEKRIIKTELKTLQTSKNIEKCSYLFYEWFGIIENDLDYMIDYCEKELEKSYNLKIHKIAELIKLSYKECL